MQGRSSARPSALGRPPAAAAAAAARLAGASAEVPGGEQQDQRDHGVRVGAEAAEEAQVLDEHPVGEAEHGPAR